MLFAPNSHYVHQQQQLCTIRKPIVRLKGAIRFNSQNRERTSDKKAAKNYEARIHTRLVQRALCANCDDKLAAAAYAVFAHMNGARRIFNDTERTNVRT
jgi:hypothetical protein